MTTDHHSDHDDHHSGRHHDHGHAHSHGQDHGHSHDHGHGHGHGHDHSHHHAPANFNRAFAIGIALNMAFVAIEAFYGWQVNSLALLADAGHNLSDVAGLVLAWVGALAVKLRPPPRRGSRSTFGRWSTRSAT